MMKEKSMKPAAILLILLCIACLAGAGWLYLTAGVTVEGYGCIAYEAGQLPEVFDTLKAQYAADAFTGTAFDRTVPGDPADYQFYEYRIRLQNSSFLKAEVIEIQVTPMTGDVAQLSVPEEQHLSPRSSGDFTATILTSRNMHNVRELTVSYYLWGLPFSTKVTYSGNL